MSLTTGTDTLIGTSGNDTFTGNKDTYANTDKVVDSSTTDNDTYSLTLEGIATPDAINVENVNITSSSTGGTQITASSLSGVKNLTVTRTDVTVGGSTIKGDKTVDILNVDASKVAKVTAGAGTTDVTVVQATKSGITVDADTATGTITVTGPATINAAAATGSVIVKGLAADNAKAVIVNAAKAVTIDVGNTTAVTGTVTVNAASATTVDVTAAGGATITVKGDKGTAGTNGVDVTAIDDSGVTVTTSYVGSTTNNAQGQIKLTAGAGGSDVATVSAAGEQQLTLTALENLNLSGNGQAVVYEILNAAADKYTVTGTQAVTLKGNAAMFAGKTVTDATTVNLTAGTAGTQDLSKVSAGTIQLGFDNAGNAITVKSGATVELTKDQTTELEFLSGTDKGTLNITIGDNNGASTATPELSVTTLSASTVDKTFETVNINTNGGKFTAATSTVLTATTNLVVTGSNDATLGTVTAKSVDASGLTGKLLGTTMGANLATLTSGSGADNITLDENTTKHTLVTGAGVDTVTITNTKATSSIDTGADGDIISIQSVNSIVVVAGDGDDSITIGAAGETVLSDAIIVGGNGTDTLTVDSDSAAVDLSTKANFSISSIEKIDLTNLDYVFTISAAQLANNATISLVGGGTADTFAVGKGNATGAVTIDLSNVTVASGSTVTILATGGDFADTITGSAKDDSIVQSKGADTINGGAGVDTYVAQASLAETGSDASQGVVVNMSNAAISGLTVFSALSVYTGNSGAEVAANTAAMSYAASKATNSTIADSISNIENVTGTAGKDYIVGSTADNTINAGAEADYIFGGDGNDTINGEAGVDNITGGAGADVLAGGTEADVYHYASSGDSAVSTATLATGNYTFTIPTSGMDTITFNAIAEDTIDLAGASGWTAVNAIAAVANGSVDATTYATASLDAFVIKDSGNLYMVYETTAGSAGALGTVEIVKLVGAIDAINDTFAVSTAGVVSFAAVV